jgi:hypothetical protein
MSEQVFSDRLETLLEAAILAPSSHNTQPWIFEASNGRISLFADRTRALPANDPDDRELAISCGAALFNLRVAAANEGIESKVSLLPKPDDDDLLAVIDTHGGPPVLEQVAELYAEIPKRRTYRKCFASKHIRESILVELAEVAEHEGAWLEVIFDAAMRQQTVKLIAKGDAIQWADRTWRRELAAWLHPRCRGDGLAVSGFVAPAARAVVRAFDMGNGVGAKDRKLAEESPVLAVLGTRGDSPSYWLEAGQALERVLLTACRAGLQASYLNQPIQIASLRPSLQQTVASDGFPQILLRLGFPRENFPAAPRRRLDAVTRQVMGTE